MKKIKESVMSLKQTFDDDTELVIAARCDGEMSYAELCDAGLSIVAEVANQSAVEAREE